MAAVLERATHDLGLFIPHPQRPVFDFIPNATMGDRRLFPSYLIVGAGCLGASTALHLKRLLPKAEVTLLDRTPFPDPLAAAHDLNKIVRSDYDDIFYMKLAIEAMQAWKDDPIYSPWYHQTGMLWAGSQKMSHQVIENYDSLAVDHEAVLLEPEEARSRFDGIFQKSMWDGLEKILWNPRAGWADAEEALRSTVQAATEIGVKYEVGTASRVLIQSDDTCIGVQTQDGRILKADQTLLCTGAQTARLLADSEPTREDLQVGGRMVAAAAIMCLNSVPDAERLKYKNAPVIINSLAHTCGESIPPGDKGLCKCTHEESFMHATLHEKSQQKISVPPSLPQYSDWTQAVPEGLKEETAEVAQHMYGDWVKGLKPESYRMCWDAVTPDQGWVICPHPASRGLFIAAGGSFHAWKFMPNIGKYIVQMLLGSLDEEKRKRWAWDRDYGEDGACEMYIPKRDLKDIKGWAQVQAAHEKAEAAASGADR